MNILRTLLDRIRVATLERAQPFEVLAFIASANEQIDAVEKELELLKSEHAAALNENANLKKQIAESEAARKVQPPSELFPRGTALGGFENVS
jgi:hypothetical protein